MRVCCAGRCALAAACVDVWQMRCVLSVPVASRRLRLLYLSCAGPWVLRTLSPPGRPRALAKDSRVGNAMHSMCQGATQVAQRTALPCCQRGPLAA